MLEDLAAAVTPAQIDCEVAAFLATEPSNADRLRLAATMLHQARAVVAPLGGDTEGPVEDALQAVLDTAATMKINVWDR